MLSHSLMSPRVYFSLSVCFALLLGACDKSDPSGTVNKPIEHAESASPALEFLPGDPRNAVLNQVRYPNHGEAKDLGLAKIGGARVKVTQYGPILEGGEGHFMIDPSPAEVEGIYIWIGNEEDGRKRRWPAMPEPDGYHVHCAVPRPLEDEHRLWIELRMPGGKRYQGQMFIEEE
jgi:hypothetical protein